MAPFVLGAFAIIALIAAVVNFRLAKKATYYSIRRKALQRAWRWVVVVFILTGCVAIVLILKNRLPLPEIGTTIGELLSASGLTSG
jgi:hypothetical protein